MRPSFALVVVALPTALSLRPPLATGCVRHARSATPVALFLTSKPPAPKKTVAGKAGARGVVKPTAIKQSMKQPIKKPTAKKTTGTKAPAKPLRKPVRELASAQAARPVAKTVAKPAKGITGSIDKKLQAYLTEQKKSLRKKRAEAQDRQNRQIVAARKARVDTIARNKENARLAKQRCSNQPALPHPISQVHQSLFPVALAFSLPCSAPD